MKLKIFILLLGGLGLLAPEGSGQSLGRVTFSSGGASVSQMPCSFGEVFSGGNGKVTMGSQQGDKPIMVSAVHTSPSATPDIKISPNPVGQTLTVEVSDLPTIKGCAIVTASSGALWIRQWFDTNKFEIATQMLPAGAYQITLASDAGTLLRTLTFFKL